MDITTRGVFPARCVFGLRLDALVTFLTRFLFTFTFAFSLTACLGLSSSWCFFVRVHLNLFSFVDHSFAVAILTVVCACISCLQYLWPASGGVACMRAQRLTLSFHSALHSLWRTCVVVLIILLPSLAGNHSGGSMLARKWVSWAAHLGVVVSDALYSVVFFLRVPLRVRGITWHCTQNFLVLYGSCDFLSRSALLPGSNPSGR